MERCLYLQITVFGILLVLTIGSTTSGLSAMNIKRKIKVLIADDHPTWVEGLSHFLELEEDMECIAKAKDGVEAVRLAKDCVPDVAILDIDMPEMDGIEAATRIKGFSPSTAIIMISAFQYDHFIIACIEAGLEGYILKSTPINELIGAIRMVNCGESVFSHQETSRVLRRFLSKSDGRSNAILRAREIEILKLAASGATNKEIAKELMISQHTVGSHFTAILRKLEVKSRTEAVSTALKRHIILISDLSNSMATEQYER
jgi:NarL family two-component system response regulator LiaR